MSGRTRVVLYGANGHTGHLAATELVARGFVPLLAGRNRDALERVASGLAGPSSIAVAALTDASALRAMLEKGDVLVNCAGPHGDTAFPLASAAIERGAHYLDTNAVEQLAAKRLFDELSGAALDAGVVVVPGMATFGGLGDLVASATARGLDRVTSVAAAYLVDGWIPTKGSMVTAAKTQGAPRLSFEAGQFDTGIEPTRVCPFDFGHPLGMLDVIANYPGVDVATIPRHVPAGQVVVHMALSTLQQFRALDPDLAARTDADARKKTDFTLVIEVRHDTGKKRMVAQGKDIYGFTATILATAIERLAEGVDTPGVLSPAQAFDAHGFLAALSKQGLRIRGA